jgi:hypothetical protein
MTERILSRALGPMSWAVGAERSPRAVWRGSRWTGPRSDGLGVRPHRDSWGGRGRGQGPGSGHRHQVPQPLEVEAFDSKLGALEEPKAGSLEQGRHEERSNAALVRRPDRSRCWRSAATRFRGTVLVRCAGDQQRGRAGSGEGNSTGAVDGCSAGCGSGLEDIR